MTTFAERLTAGDGHPRGFDYLRLALAASIVAFHSFATTHDLAADHELWRSPLRCVLRLLVPMFFALSGFLVAGSLLRSRTLLEFGALRILRIVPALFAEIALSAVILGPLLTEFPLRRYFAEREFWGYFANVIGRVHFALPGMFLHNPRPGMVNGSLWTIPFEGLCYLTLALLAVAGLVQRKRSLLALLGVAIAAFTISLVRTGAPLLAPPGTLLVVAFFAGIAAHLCRERLRHDARLFVLASLTTLLLLYYDNSVFLAVIPLTYVTVYLGLTRPRKTALLSGDYSYGIYLFAYPIQQTCVLLFPSLRTTLGCFLVALPVGVAYAIFSWHCIEHPILRRKKRILGLLFGRERGVLGGDSRESL